MGSVLTASRLVTTSTGWVKGDMGDAGDWNGVCGVPGIGMPVRSNSKFQSVLKLWDEKEKKDIKKKPLKQKLFKSLRLKKNSRKGQDINSFKYEPPPVIPRLNIRAIPMIKSQKCQPSDQEILDLTFNTDADSGYGDRCSNSSIQVEEMD